MEGFAVFIIHDELKCNREHGILNKRTIQM